MGKALDKLLGSIKTTTDLVVVILAGFVVIVLTMSTIGVFVYAFLNPGDNLNAPLTSVLDIITVIVGALVGFIGGKAAGKSEAEIERRDEEPPS